MVQCYVVRLGETGGHEILQMRRAPNDFMGGCWQTVFGKIEGEETAWQAAIRELREETSLVPIEFYQLDTVNTFYLAADDSIWLCPSFCAVVDRHAQLQLNEEHDAARWIKRDEADSAFLWPGERAALVEMCREILDDGPAKQYLRIKLDAA